MSEEIEYIIEESLSPDRYCLVHNYIVSLQQKVEQLEKENKKLKEDKIFLKTYLTKLSNKYIKNDLLNILNKGSDKE